MKLTMFCKKRSRILLLLLPLFCIAWFDGDTDLIKAVEKEDIVQVTKLINKGADINEKGKNGRTALMVAVENYNIELINLLLAHGAKIIIYDDMGITVYGHIGWKKIDKTNKMHSQKRITPLETRSGHFGCLLDGIPRKVLQGSPVVVKSAL